MDEIFEHWDTPVSLPNTDAELKTIRRNLRRRNWKTILTSVVLIIAILFGAVRYGIPALEKQYWDPTQCTYLEDVTDLELTMATYSELFGHGKNFGAVDVQKQGFAKYALNTVFLEWETINRLTGLSFRSASLDRGEVSLPANFWLDAGYGFFIRDLSGSKDFIQGYNTQTQSRLRELPEYIQLLAGVTFAEDQTMDQLRDLKFTNIQTTHFLWAALRNDPEADHFSLCGVRLADYPSEQYLPSHWNNTDYPKLFLDVNWTGQDMEQHVTSMLRFSADQFRAGTGFSPSGEDDTYYQKTLAYLEENGIRSYGAYVIATPSALLKMLEDGSAACINLIDARIGI